MLDHPRETDWAFLYLDSASWWRMFFLFFHMIRMFAMKEKARKETSHRLDEVEAQDCRRLLASGKKQSMQTSTSSEASETSSSRRWGFYLEIFYVALRSSVKAPPPWHDQIIHWMSHCILHFQKSCWTHHNKWCKVESVSISSSLQWGPEVSCTSTSRHTSAFGLCATSGSNLCPCGPCMTKLFVCEASWRGHVFWSLAADSAPIGVHIGASKVIGPFHADQIWEPPSPSPPDKAKVTWNALRDPCTSHPARSRHFAAFLSRSLTRWNAQNVLSPSVAATRQGFL